MMIVNIHKAKAKLSRLVDEAAEASLSSLPKPASPWSRSPRLTPRLANRSGGLASCADSSRFPTISTPWAATRSRGFSVGQTVKLLQMILTCCSGLHSISTPF